MHVTVLIGQYTDTKKFKNTELKTQVKFIKLEAYTIHLYFWEVKFLYTILLKYLYKLVIKDYFYRCKSVIERLVLVIHVRSITFVIAFKLT